MKKIVLAPLDERPCTYMYPNMLANMANNINLVEVPKELMGDLKKPGNIEKIADFLIDECKDASYAIIAIDTLLYGGIVPSRLHYENEETLLKRLNILKKIKEVNPNIKLYAYHLIMRCPSSSSDCEEPDYYALCGREIHLIGAYEHMASIKKLTDSQQKEYDEAKKFIINNNYQAYVDDYLNRRKINVKMNLHTLDLLKDGIIDFLIIPQDDSAPYGLTAKDQIIVREKIINKRLELKALMYPDADAVSNTLLAKCINEINNIRPKVFVRYSSCNNGNIIPNYEDRPVSESIKYQIIAAGGLSVYSLKEADMVLMVNVPYNNMKEARSLYDSIVNGTNETNLDYTVGRNLIEYIEYIKHLISINKCVAIADIAYANGGDINLFNLLKNENLLFKVDSYAGWNTAANTLGTCIPLAMIHNIYKDSQAFFNFMGLRYLEDVGYMSFVRFKAFDLFKNEFAWKEIDGKENGQVATFIRNELIKWCNENLNSNNYSVEIIKHEQPWNRFFETGLIVKTTISI
ncbi:MAG: DUF4127 family protein [Candidatus Caccosoma sp.]|nr:DUF4127 family protein [Candidatus Caccosoma sp.]